MKVLIIILICLVCLFILMKIVAALRTEDKTKDDNNPYIYPEYAVEVLPSEMAEIAEHMPDEPERHVGFYEKHLKRLLDIVLSFFGLVILSPLFGIVSIAIKIDDPGPVFFTQKRVGKDKRYFALHKYRSMKMDTPHDIPTHMLENPDQYITKVGHFLRKSSLDEIPQIWDVFRGRMSVIGPRPALWNQADLVAEREKYGVNSAAPGLTGLAQINGRDELEIVDKAKIDGRYVEKITFWIDVKCFVGSIFSVFKADGVVEGGTGEMNKGRE